MLFYFNIPALSKERLEPWRDGGLLPGRLPVLEVGLELGLELPGVEDILYDGLRGVRNTELSLSDSESGVPAEYEVFDTLGKLPMGTDLADRSRTWLQKKE